MSLVAIVLLAQAMDLPILGWVAKPLASLGFLAAAWTRGASATRHGRWILAALVFGWFGDVLLMGRTPILFLSGLVSFLLGHLAYCGAFLARGVRWRRVLLALLILAPLGVAVVQWIVPHVQAREAGLVAPVLAYVAVISGMVCLAAGSASGLLPLAAVAFFGSDLSVARDVFVEPGLMNRLWGLPLYYAAQLMFASEAGLRPDPPGA